MKDNNKVNGTDTFVPYDHITSRTNLLKSLDELLGREEATTAIKVREAKSVLVEVTEGTTGRHRYQPKAARVSWVQRVLSWFKTS